MIHFNFSQYVVICQLLISFSDLALFLQTTVCGRAIQVNLMSNIKTQQSRGAGQQKMLTGIAYVSISQRWRLRVGLESCTEGTLFE